MSNYGEGQERQTETGLQHLQGGEIKIGLKKQHEKGHVKWHVKYYDETGEGVKKDAHPQGGCCDQLDN